MCKVLKWSGFILLGLLAVMILATAGLYVSTNSRLNKVYAAPAETISIPEDAASLENGKHLVNTRCAGCHGTDLAGSVMFDDPMLGTVIAPNIGGTQGAGGQPLSDGDLIAAIRYGIGPDGKGLFIMPSDAFYFLSDEDLGDMLAYLKSANRVERALPPVQNTFIGNILVGAGAFGEVLAVERIDQSASRPVVEPGITAEYGEYLVTTSDCRVCHGAQMGGGKDPNPDAPPVPDLTRNGELASWTEADFISTLRTGVNPSGQVLDPEFMPWVYAGKMTDDELKAVWLYLQSLPVSAAMQ